MHTYPVTGGNYGGGTPVQDGMGTGVVGAPEPVVQQVDDAMRVYLQIIEDTLAASKGLQNPKVLEQIKLKWLTNLRARIASRPEVEDSRARGTLPSRGDRVVPRADSLKRVSIKVDPTAVTRVGGPMAPKVLKREGDIFDPSRRSALLLTPGSLAVDPDEIMRGALADRVKMQQETKAEFPGRTDEFPPPEAPEEHTEEEEDGWGEWETPEDAVAVLAKIEGVDTDQDATPVPGKRGAQTTKSEETETGAIVDAETGQLLPTAEDFAIKIRAQYGRGAKVEGNTLASWNALVWENPDEVDESLDNVSDLSDDEPEARDVVVGQLDMMQKPTGRKATSVGLWKMRLRNGIARIDDQEIFFDTFYAELEYSH